MGDRSLCAHTFDTLCVNELNGEHEYVPCEECPYYNGGKDVYEIGHEEGQESYEEARNKLYVEALEWWDRLTPMEKIGIRKVIKNIQEGNK